MLEPTKIDDRQTRRHNCMAHLGVGHMCHNPVSPPLAVDEFRAGIPLFGFQKIYQPGTVLTNIGVDSPEQSSGIGARRFDEQCNSWLGFHGVSCRDPYLVLAIER